jgi:hypothetical protein
MIGRHIREACEHRPELQEPPNPTGWCGGFVFSIADLKAEMTLKQRLTEIDF